MQKLGRFVVDTHVHSQRHAAGKDLKGSKDYGDLGHAMFNIIAYDNSPRLLYDMECYGVDMCVLLPAFGMTNETNVEQVKKYPDKFVAVCQAKETRDKAARGEIRWTMDAACEELDALLATGSFVGIGAAHAHADNQSQRSGLRRPRRAHDHQGYDESDGPGQEIQGPRSLSHGHAGRIRDSLPRIPGDL